jgi:hypothetical protein
MLITLKVYGHIFYADRDRILTSLVKRDYKYTNPTIITDIVLRNHDGRGFRPSTAGVIASPKIVIDIVALSTVSAAGTGTDDTTSDIIFFTIGAVIITI